MRQSGMLAAACLYALDHHIERLAEDHENARRLAAGLSAIPSVRVNASAVETNIVIFDVSDAPTFIARLKGEGVLAAGVSPTAVRLVTHLDVGDAEIERAIDALGRAAKTS